MKTRFLIIPASVTAAALTLTAGVVAAQDAPPAAPPAAQSAPAAEVVAPAAPSTPDWNPISRSGTRAYLAEVNGIKTTGDVTSIQLARVPLNSDAGDYHFTLDDYEFQCAAANVRITVSTEFENDGVTGDAVPDASATWEDIPADSLDDYVKRVACDNSRAVGTTYPSVKAYIDAGRP